MMSHVTKMPMLIILVLIASSQVSDPAERIGMSVSGSYYMTLLATAKIISLDGSMSHNGLTNLIDQAN